MKILVVSPLDQYALAKLRTEHDVTYALHCTHDEIKQRLAECDGLVFRSGVAINADLLSSAPRLKLVIRAGSGVDNVDLDCIAQRNIDFHRIPEPAAQAVAELAIALMLALARNLRRAHEEWERGHWIKEKLEGQLLAGKVLGVVGLGNIGTRVAELGVSLGMRLFGCVARPTEVRRCAFRTKHIELVPFDSVVSVADYLSIHVPLNESTRNLLGTATLDRMKPTAILVNLARGGVVDEQALRSCLLQGRIAGAALDVHEKEGEGNISPLAGLPNVLLTPHIGSMTRDTQRQIGERVVEIATRYLVGHAQPPVAVAERATCEATAQGGRP